MGACDAGRCCKGSACTDDKKCCCQAKSGNFAVGEVCRTASCNTGGSCFNNVPVCECLAGGGSLTQSCDPCDGVVCDKCQQCVIGVDGRGVCVSTCGICQVCDTSSINGTCVPKTCVPACGQCQECRCFNGQTSCVVVGVICGAGCCALNECCVDGACVSCDCSGQVKPGPCYECVNGSYVPILGTPCVTLCCTPGLACCNGVCCPDGQFCSNNHCCPTGQKWCGSACAECCADSDCADNEKCVAGACEPKQCSDYHIYVTYYPCPGPTGGCCCDYIGPFDRVFSGSCPPGCVTGSLGEYGPGRQWPPPWGTQVIHATCAENALP